MPIFDTQTFAHNELEIKRRKPGLINFLAKALVLVTIFMFNGLSEPRAQNSVDGNRYYQMGVESMRSNNAKRAFEFFQASAATGHIGSKWQLARMYQHGAGVGKNSRLAYQLFYEVSSLDRNKALEQPYAMMVGNAIYQLGLFHLEGDRRAGINKDIRRAVKLINYAASTYGDVDAAFQLGKMYYEGGLVKNDPRLSARWLDFAARRKHKEARALLGSILFNGTNVKRQPALGLMWLTLANAEARGSKDKWIVDAYRDAFSMATDNERSQAAREASQWQK